MLDLPVATEIRRANVIISCIISSIQSFCKLMIVLVIRSFFWRSWVAGKVSLMTSSVWWWRFYRSRMHAKIGWCCSCDLKWRHILGWDIFEVLCTLSCTCIMHTWMELLLHGIDWACSVSFRQLSHLQTQIPSSTSPGIQESPYLCSTLLVASGAPIGRRSYGSLMTYYATSQIPT